MVRTLDEDHGLAEEDEQCIHRSHRTPPLIVQSAVNAVCGTGNDGEENSERLFLASGHPEPWFLSRLPVHVLVSKAVKRAEGGIAAEMMLQHLGSFTVALRDLGERLLRRGDQEPQLLVELRLGRIRRRLDETVRYEQVDDVLELPALMSASIVDERLAVTVRALREKIGVLL